MGATKNLLFKEVYHYLNLSSSIPCWFSADHDYDNPPESSNSENGMCSDEEEEEDDEEEDHSSDEGNSDDSSSIGNLKYQQVTQVSQ